MISQARFRNAFLVAWVAVRLTFPQCECECFCVCWECRNKCNKTCWWQIFFIVKSWCHLDWSDGQFFMAMECRWVFFSSDGMAMVLKISHHHHWWFLVGSTIGNNGFSMVFFPILGTNGSRWLQTEICDKKSAQLKMKTEMQAKDLFHRKSLIVSISLGIVLSTIYFV